MHVFGGRLYLGARNSNNSAPATNAGRVPIVCYDPVKDEFLREGTVDDEQIDRYYTHDGQLYIPGHDPIESWRLGNFYRRRDNGRWQKHRTIPGAIHLYAMAWHEGRLFGGLGIRNSAAVSVSLDQGRTWNVLQTGGRRVYEFLVMTGCLYAAEMIPTPKKVESWPDRLRIEFFCVSEFQTPDQFVPRRDITAETLFPGTHFESNRWMKAIHAQAPGSKTLYIGAYCHTDHQSLPFGLFLASSLGKGNPSVRPITLPDRCRPWGWLVRDNRLYVLLEAEQPDGAQVRVVRFHDKWLSSYEEVLYFEVPTFARSFEILDGDFYFGLGCSSRGELPPATGDILRVRAEFTE
ncbi:MAG: hypothetical protein JSW27_16790 [Phycisphaerales bacterium]|nr:MAG: hypothetical protein JSW27_16790 [Phycisphaerales bacterium]